MTGIFALLFACSHVDAAVDLYGCYLTQQLEYLYLLPPPSPVTPERLTTYNGGRIEAGDTVLDSGDYRHPLAVARTPERCP